MTIRSRTPSDAGTSDLLRVRDAPVTLFGHSPTSATLGLEPRPRSWRVRRALPPLVVTLLVAPVLSLVPPHVPWALVTLGSGAFVAWRRWREEYTIQAFDARCPRCRSDLEIRAGTRLRFPHPLTCPGCRHEPVVDVEEDRVSALRDGSA